MGRRNRLVVLRSSVHGAFLGRDGFEVLLPRKEVPAGLSVGDEIDVFVHHDSEDRPVATVRVPLARADEFASLVVKDVNRTGAFLDWGLAKDLLLPFREQARPIRRAGGRVVVRIYRDPVSGRLVASTRLRRFLSPPPRSLHIGQGVQLLPFQRTDLGFTAIVDRSFEGLLFLDAGEREPEIGLTVPGYVRRIRPDGRVDLALRPVGREGARLARDVVLEALEQHGGRLALGDQSDPERIREALDLSKKAFKRAVGALYREGRVAITDEAISLLSDGGDSEAAALRRVSPGGRASRRVR
jgi:predicted RNA-binding protein (virulence factor B family)